MKYGINLMVKFRWIESTQMKEEHNEINHRLNSYIIKTVVINLGLTFGHTYLAIYARFMSRSSISI